MEPLQSCNNGNCSTPAKTHLPDGDRRKLLISQVLEAIFGFRCMARS